MRDSSCAMPGWRRPLRVPKNINLTHATPPVAYAGMLGRWRLPFKISRDVPADSQLKLQIFGGRNNRCVFSAQCDNPAEEGFLSATLAGGQRLCIRQDKTAGTFNLAMPPAGLKKGDRLIVVLGDCSNGSLGSRPETLRALNKMFVLYHVPAQKNVPETPRWAGGNVWAKDTAEFMLAVCTLHVLGGPIHSLRAYGPASTQPGDMFRLVVRPEDMWGNLASEAPGDLRLSFDGALLPAVFEAVPASTCRVAMVALKHEGVARLRVFEPCSGREAITPPICCAFDRVARYWGMIHGHTEMSDGLGALNEYFHQIKNEARLDFAATSDHDHVWETPDEYWRLAGGAVKRWNKPGKFVVFPGYEWAKWRRNGDGDRNVYYLKDGRPIYRSDDANYPSPPDLFDILRKNNEQAIIIPHHTGHAGNFCDWKDHDPKFERLVEIYQERGSFECSEADGNPAPERDQRHAPREEGFVRRALAMGWRIGFTGGGDDHSGGWGTERVLNPRTGYKQGAMSVEAAGLTRKALFQGLYNRRTVATTGARILVSYKLDDLPMGSECSARDRPWLEAKRRLTVSINATAPLARVDIIRNNKTARSIQAGNKLDLEFVWVDTQPLSELWLPPAKHCNHPFVFYYVRVVQVDREAAWASPIWIDP